jgi:SagB-type dehydrogenase family enzyme
MGFVDDEANHLLGVDGEREMSLSLVPLGRTGSPPTPPPKEIPRLEFETVPLSRKEVDYPIIREMHAASKLRDADGVVAWRSSPLELPSPRPEGKIFPLKSIEKAVLPGETLESVIVRRASTRQFAQKPISFEQLSTMLDRATRGIPTDFLGTSGAQLNDLYLNVHAVEGLPSGAYFFRRQDQALELLKEGDFRNNSAYLCLEQPLGGDSSATVFFLADLNRVFERYGNRGYRAAQMEAGIIGGKLYLTAYALGQGATGLTFYDDDVTAFFSPHAADKSTIFVTALGVPGRRPIM